MMGYGAWGGMGAFGGFGMLFGLVFWVGVIALVVWGASALFAPRQDQQAVAPLEILKRRFASGEISEAEYQQARARLSGDSVA